MTQYQYTVNGTVVTGALTWNANGTLNQLAITDGFNGSNSQTCSYIYDDLARINNVNCVNPSQQPVWTQAFGIGVFGNLAKTGTNGGTSFSASYSSNTNHISSVGTQTYGYNGNGDVTSTGSGTGSTAYTWDAEGKMDSVTPYGGTAVTNITYDAFGRMVEYYSGGAYSQFVYDGLGDKLARMSGQTLAGARVPLPGRAVARYTSGPTLSAYWHTDWQGSVRFASTPTSPTTDFYDTGIAPYGEHYASSAPGGTVGVFAGTIQDTITGMFDTPGREYDTTSGRWLSPDPAGLAAVDLTNPQSLNRYAYVGNNPTTLTDPSGLQGQGPCANLQYGPGKGQCLNGAAGVAMSNSALGPAGWDLFDLIWAAGFSGGGNGDPGNFSEGFDPNGAQLANFLSGSVPYGPGATGPTIGPAPPAAPKPADNRPSCISVLASNFGSDPSPTGEVGEQAGSTVSTATALFSITYQAVRGFKCALCSPSVRFLADVSEKAGFLGEAFAPAWATYEIVKAEVPAIKANLTGQCQNNFWSSVPPVPFP